MSSFTNLPLLLSYCRTSKCVKAKTFAGRYESFEKHSRHLLKSREMSAYIVL